MREKKIDILLDSVIMSEIEKYSWIIKGVTTTPTFFKREGINYDEFIENFRKTYPNLEIHVEALGQTVEKTEKEIQNIMNQEWFDRDKVVLKIPVSFENLRLVQKYAKDGIRFNVHLVFTANQASVATMVSADYVCPLIGRYADTMSSKSGKNLHGGNTCAGSELLKDVRSAIEYVRPESETKVMASSIRTVGDYYTAIMNRADVVTVPTKVMDVLLDHEMTKQGVETFLRDMGYEI